MKRQTRRQNPRGYDGTGITSYNMRDYLPDVLQKIHEVHSERPDLVLAAWPQVIGERFATMTQAVSFTEGILVVKVKNSTLYSLLTQHEKPKILYALRTKFPRTNIRNVVFNMG